MVEEEKKDKEVSQQEEPKKEEKKEEKPEIEKEAQPQEPEKELQIKEEKSVEVPKKFQKIVEEIEEMKVIDLAELVKILEKKFGVSAAAPVAVIAAPVAGAAEAGVEEKAEYNVILNKVGDKKIEVIKAVRDATAKGLKEAKDMVDAAANESQVVRENVKKEEAEELKKKFEAAGATIELK